MSGRAAASLRADRERAAVQGATTAGDKRHRSSPCTEGRNRATATLHPPTTVTSARDTRSVGAISFLCLPIQENLSPNLLGSLSKQFALGGNDAVKTTRNRSRRAGATNRRMPRHA